MVNAICTILAIAVAMVGKPSAFTIPLIRTILLWVITTRNVLITVRMLLRP